MPPLSSSIGEPVRVFFLPEAHFCHRRQRFCEGGLCARIRLVLTCSARENLVGDRPMPSSSPAVTLFAFISATSRVTAHRCWSSRLVRFALRLAGDGEIPRTPRLKEPTGNGKLTDCNALGKDVGFPSGSAPEPATRSGRFRPSKVMPEHELLPLFGWGASSLNTTGITCVAEGHSLFSLFLGQP